MKWVRISFFLIVALSFISSISYANNGYEIDKKHAAQGISCSDCHLTDNPTKKAKMSECLKCHESYEAVASKTASLAPNPHKSHQGELKCNLCHKVHSPNTLYCNSCHGFTQYKFK